ncbi:MAG: LolA family protein, partial [Mycobacteriales bacterium]
LAVTYTPAQVAARAIAAITPSTLVSVGTSAYVAHRSAYELELSPRAAGSLVQTVAIAVDSATGVPLRVQVFAVGQHPAALSIGFTSVRFAVPALSVFRFSPPPGATVHPLRRPTRTGTAAPAGSPSTGKVSQLGQGWDSVVALGQVKLGKNASLFLRASTPADGGRLLTTSLVTAFLAPDGTLYLGAVTPTQLLADVATGT